MPRHPVARAAPALLAITACLTACVTATPDPVPLARMPAPTLAAPVPRRADLLTDSELPVTDTRTLLDIAAARWPGVVRGELPRGNGERLALTPTSSFEDRFGVYDVRGAFLGGPEYLAGIGTAEVVQIRRLSDTEEHAAFGRRHPAGAIVLTWAHGTR